MSTKPHPKFYVGQTVMVGQPWKSTWRWQEETVTKVGRTRVTVGDGRMAVQFHMDDGSEVRGENAIGLPEIVRTMAERADDCHRGRLLMDLDKHGLGLLGYGRGSGPSTSKLAAVVELLES